MEFSWRCLGGGEGVFWSILLGACEIGKWFWVYLKNLTMDAVHSFGQILNNSALDQVFT